MKKILKKSVSYKIARLISTVFVPPSFTILLFTYFALKYEDDPGKILATILTAFIFGFTLQIILFISLRKRGIIADLDVSDKEERTKPFLISIVFYLAGLLVLISAGINIVSIGFWFCYISNTLIVILINKVWKISVHATGAAGPAAALTYAAGTGGLLLVPVIIAVGWSRVKLKCHNPAQVAAGVIFGFCSTYAQIYFIYRWFGHG